MRPRSKQAQANLANAKANLELQQVEANRSAELFTNKLISSSDYDTAIATSARSRSHGANQPGLARQRERKSGLLQNPFAGGWHCDFARGRSRPDGGVQFQHADAFSNRE